ncbi:UNVERIFIED_CONTAM: hypothetical protein FKN15_031929 [Acipenser sinensis]
MWQYLQRELAAVQSEISEWRDSMDNWHQHCQIMMKSCTGIDYKEFYMFLNIISKNRISFLHSFGGDTGSSRIQHPHDLSTLGPHHAVFDLNKVAQVLECVLSNEEFKKLDPDSLSSRPEDLLQKIKEATEKTPL